MPCQSFWLLLFHHLLVLHITHPQNFHQVAPRHFRHNILTVGITDSVVVFQHTAIVAKHFFALMLQYSISVFQENRLSWAKLRHTSVSWKRILAVVFTADLAFNFSKPCLQELLLIHHSLSWPHCFGWDFSFVHPRVHQRLQNRHPQNHHLRAHLFGIGFAKQTYFSHFAIKLTSATFEAAVARIGSLWFAEYGTFVSTAPCPLHRNYSYAFLFLNN